MKAWEVVADNLKKAEFNLGWVSAVDSEGQTIWIVDAHRDGKRPFVRTGKAQIFVARRTPLHKKPH
jgi:hypothetical protein